MNTTERFLDNIRTAVQTASVVRDPNVEANLLGELTGYYARLSDIVVDAKHDRDTRESEYKDIMSEKRQEYRGEGKSVQDATDLARIDLEDRAKVLLRATRRYDMVRGYRENIEKTMDTLRTRISLAKQEVIGNRSIT